MSLVPFDYPFKSLYFLQNTHFFSKTTLTLLLVMFPSIFRLLKCCELFPCCIFSFSGHIFSKPSFRFIGGFCESSMWETLSKTRKIWSFLSLVALKTVFQALLLLDQIKSFRFFNGIRCGKHESIFTIYLYYLLLIINAILFLKQKTIIP